MTLEDFKDMVNNDKDAVKRICMRSDVIDMDNGTMLIYSENIDKYLEQYACKNAEDFSDTMWFNYGIFVKIVD